MSIIRWITLVGVLALLLSVWSVPAHATDARSTENRLRSTNPTIEIDYHNQTGLASYVYAPDGLTVVEARRTTSPAGTARQFMNAYGSMFGITAQASELAIINEFESIDGESIVRFQQMYQNIPVVGAELNFSLSSARMIQSINGELLPRINMSITPTITDAQALQIGLASVSKKFEIDQASIGVTSVSLAVFDQRIMGGFGPPTPTLTWQVRLTNWQHVNPFDAYIFVDAHTSMIVTQFNQIAYALNQRICDSANTRDSDDNSRTNCDDDSKAIRLNDPTASGVTDADDAWEFTKATYDYFYDTFGRDGIDNAGMTMISIVRYCYSSPEPCPYSNAFWDGQVMTYGDGFSSADDVIAHEITHGITERTANLFYYFQSGAINEAVSDIFGEFVDQHYAGTSTDGTAYNWQLGEDLPASIGVIRNMRNPPQFYHPDRMNSRYYDNGYYPGYEWPMDNGGVHSNSGVANKATVLMVGGGRFNRQTITALGKAKTEQLWYRVLTTKLLAASDYANLATALVQTCKQMANSSIAGMTLSDCTNVNNVVTATEMRLTPNAAPAVNSPLCPTGKTMRNTWYDNMESYRTTWTGSGVSWYDHTYATSGQNSALAYADFAARRDLRLTQKSNVLLPARAYLHFNHAYEFASKNLATSAADQYFHGSIVEYSINNGRTWQNLGPLFINRGYNGTIKTPSNNVLKGQRAFVGVSHGYVSSRANLATLAGKRVKFRFRYTTDGVNYPWYGWWIDDIRIYTCR